MAVASEIPAAKIQGKKGVEAFLRHKLELVQSRFEGVSGKVLGQVADLRKTLEVAPKETLDKLKGLLAKAPIAQVEKVVTDGVKFTEDAVRRLGLAKLADKGAIKDAFEGLQKQIAQLKTRVDAFVASSAATVATAEEAIASDVKAFVKPTEAALPPTEKAIVSDAKE